MHVERVPERQNITRYSVANLFRTYLFDLFTKFYQNRPSFMKIWQKHFGSLLPEHCLCMYVFV